MIRLREEQTPKAVVKQHIYNLDYLVEWLSTVSGCVEGFLIDRGTTDKTIWVNKSQCYIYEIGNDANICEYNEA